MAYSVMARNFVEWDGCCSGLNLLNFGTCKLIQMARMPSMRSPLPLQGPAYPGDAQLHHHHHESRRLVGGPGTPRQQRHLAAPSAGIFWCRHLASLHAPPCAAPTAPISSACRCRCFCSTIFWLNVRGLEMRLRSKSPAQQPQNPTLATPSCGT